jgi:hypothetical protein
VVRRPLVWTHSMFIKRMALPFLLKWTEHSELACVCYLGISRAF